MKNKQTHRSGTNHMVPVEYKYHRALRMLSRHRPSPQNKRKEEEIAYLINKIETYGFDFYPNHYIFDDVVKLEKLVMEL